MSQNDTIHTFKVTISTKNSQLKQGETLVLVMVVKNISDNFAKFCKYHTPFEGITNEFFEVTKDGKKLPYQGVLKKRRPTTETDYINLSPEESTTCKVSLTPQYDIKNKGKYTIRFLGSAISQLNDSNEISFQIK